jgi:hypothetical protein
MAGDHDLGTATSGPDSAGRQGRGTEGDEEAEDHR